MFRSILLFAVALFIPAIANASTVLTSFKPIQMIVTELTQGVSEPDVLMNSNASPHDYALKPSDVKKIQQADMVIWFGRDLESFLVKVLEQRDNVITISEIPNLNLREFGDLQHDAHEGHDHGSHDPHFWLGIEQVKVTAKHIVSELVKLDPKNKAHYKQNLEVFIENLSEAKLSIQAQVLPVKDTGYYVFHDAYGYFEQEFELNNLGYFTVSPDRKPGAKTLIKIRNTLIKDNVQCVFSEPQFTPAVIDSVTRGSKTVQGQLDPIGSKIQVQSGSYFDFLQQLTTSYTDCLTIK